MDRPLSPPASDSEMRIPSWPYRPPLGLVFFTTRPRRASRPQRQQRGLNEGLRLHPQASRWPCEAPAYHDDSSQCLADAFSTPGQGAVTLVCPPPRERAPPRPPSAVTGSGDFHSASLSSSYVTMHSTPLNKASLRLSPRNRLTATRWNRIVAIPGPPLLNYLL